MICLVVYRLNCRYTYIHIHLIEHNTTIISRYLLGLTEEFKSISLRCVSRIILQLEQKAQGKFPLENYKLNS